MSISEDFENQTVPFRHELLAHCYQMLGSVHDAEDLVQETLLRAWRAYDRFDGRRASMRTWLYRIATNACLTALEGRARRPLPSGLAGPGDDPKAPMVQRPEVPWVEPIPDALLGTRSADPAAVILARGQLRLALIAALQLLPARQRAILIMREVLEWPAAEVAAALDTTPAAVNSGLQRARARLGELGIGEDQVDEPAAADQRALVDRYVTAFVDADLSALAGLLTEDVVLEMPPVDQLVPGPGALRPVHGPCLCHAGCGLADAAGGGQRSAGRGGLRPGRERATNALTAGVFRVRIGHRAERRLRRPRRSGRPSTSRPDGEPGAMNRAAM